ncbi:MAG: GNAT family N-acetyltransferase [Anaerolineaceae bacterium]|nr:GNAT family N-acetyltransferase [Anaerolineaceae bacterium]
MKNIKSARLQLIALTLEQLKICFEDPDRLSKSLGLSLSPDLFPDPVRKAIDIKIFCMEEQAKHLHPWFTYWLIVTKKSRQIIGMVGFKGAPHKPGQVEIGYGISQDQRGCGYATEAVQALINWAFKQPMCHTVVAETLKNNIASMRVLEKVGMQVYDETEEILAWRIDKERLLGTHA